MATKTTDADFEWTAFLSKTESYAQDSPEKWTAYTFLAYFIVKYKSVNGLDFIFSANKKGPTHSRELKAASTVWAAFDKNRLKTMSKEDKTVYKT